MKSIFPTNDYQAGQTTFLIMAKGQEVDNVCFLCLNHTIALNKDLDNLPKIMILQENLECRHYQRAFKGKIRFKVIHP